MPDIAQKLQNLVYFGKKDRFFQKKFLKFSKSLLLNVAVFFKNAFQMVILIENVFSDLVVMVFENKSENLERSKS